jgi:ABC-type transport system involved in multi-copper enzyme maturation permease subunit
VASRRQSTYWIRAGAALLVMGVGTWILLMMRRESPQDASEVVFGVLTGGAVFYALLCGVRSTADCLSEEKREGTLGLLFLTDLKGYDVVLGKLAANSISAIYGVLAVVPMLAIPLLLGGVTPGEFWRMALVAVNTMFFSLSAGIFVSALARSPQKAFGATFALVVFLSGALPGIGAWVTERHRLRIVPIEFLLASPGFSYYMAWDMNFRRLPQEFWLSLGVIQVMGWLGLAAASVVVPHTWKDRPAGAQALRWRERWRLWCYGDLADRKEFRHRMLETNAFYWLASRARLKPAGVWAVLGVLGCGWLWGMAKFRHEWLNTGIYITTGIILNLLLRGWFAGEAARQFSEERKAGTLELLLSTPLEVEDILRGQRLALRRQFLGPVVFVLVVEVMFLFGTLSDTSIRGEREFATWLWILGMVMLVADLWALHWIGMWQGLTARNPVRASGAAASRILVFPWVVIGLLVLLITLAAIGSRSGPDFGPGFVLGLWFVVGIVTDLGFGGWSRQKILTEFRLAATQRYVQRASIWKRMFGG